MEIVKNSQAEMQEYLYSQISSQKEGIAKYVRQKQVRTPESEGLCSGDDHANFFYKEEEVIEKIRAKEELETILQQNEKRIQEQRQKLAEITHVTEAERQKELERFRLEREEEARREVCSFILNFVKFVNLGIERTFRGLLIDFNVLGGTNLWQTVSPISFLFLKIAVEVALTEKTRFFWFSSVRYVQLRHF